MEERHLVGTTLQSVCMAMCVYLSQSVEKGMVPASACRGFGIPAQTQNSSTQLSLPLLAAVSRLQNFLETSHSWLASVCLAALQPL